LYIRPICLPCGDALHVFFKTAQCFAKLRSLQGCCRKSERIRIDRNEIFTDRLRESRKATAPTAGSARGAQSLLGSEEVSISTAAWIESNHEPHGREIRPHIFMSADDFCIRCPRQLSRHVGKRGSGSPLTVELPFFLKTLYFRLVLGCALSQLASPTVLGRLESGRIEVHSTPLKSVVAQIRKLECRQTEDVKNRLNVCRLEDAVLTVTESAHHATAVGIARDRNTALFHIVRALPRPGFLRSPVGAVGKTELDSSHQLAVR
jgi:hypothetical protein